MSGKYDDIIGLSRPESSRPKMPLNDRAAQFAPFAALTKFGEEIKESNRKTVYKEDFSDDYLEETDFVFRQVEENIARRPKIKVKYFVPDERKEGGAEKDFIGNVKKIDRAFGEIEFEDGFKLKTTDIIFIELTD